MSLLTGRAHRSMRFAGIIYLHSLTDTRMNYSSIQSLRMFRRLCGNDRRHMRNVILATTKLSTVPASVARQREDELQSTEEFWGLMIANGSKVERFRDTKDSAEEIVTTALDCGRRTFTPRFQQEIIEGRELAQTEAGIYLQENLRKLQREHEERDENLRQHIAEAQRDRESCPTHLISARDYGALYAYLTVPATLSSCVPHPQLEC